MTFRLQFPDADLKTGTEFRRRSFVQENLKSETPEGELGQSLSKSGAFIHLRARYHLMNVCSLGLFHRPSLFLHR